MSLFFNIVRGTISYYILRKTDSEKAKKCFTLGLVLFLIPIIILVVLNLVPGMQYSAYMVKTSANEQNLRIHDVVIVDYNIPFENIKVGDVIVFYNPGTHQEVLVHRVAEILAKDPFAVRTKGDKSSESISGLDYPITKQEYVGKIAYIIPQVGYATKFITVESVLIIVTVIIGTGIVQHEIYRKRKSLADTKAKAEKDANDDKHI